ncbi:MAG: hypothetical protein EOM92_10480 [Gammaproteobacteria bacterium]|jgi:ATP-dependent Lon protease|nr:hypothetical protein [Gammaproteobacteria bacterium]
MQLDDLDRKAAERFEGYLVRKDLVRQFSRQFPVPTYVVEFLLGRYCATIDEEEINEGLDIVQRQLASRTVKAGEQELFKARTREEGTVKLIDLISARLDAKTDAYLAHLPSLQLKDVRITPERVREHERLLTGGFYAEVTLSYDAAIAQELHGRPFGIDALRAIQLSKRDVLEVLAEKTPRGGLVVIGELNLGGSIEPINNAVTLVEMAIEKGAQVVLMPVSSRRQLFDLSDDMATKVDIQFYQDARDALLKALVE